MSASEVSHVTKNLLPGSESLYIFFGGISGGLGIPPFEFYRSAQIVEASKIFLRDPYQAWYQRGLPGIGDDIIAVANYISTCIEESGSKRICFIGNSMGGFAALLFSTLLRCGKVIAFVPQVFVSKEKRLRHQDRRWSREIGSMLEHRTASHIYELDQIIREKFPEINANVFVSLSDKLDLIHAEQLEEFENIRIHRISAAGHNLVRELRADGTLEKILRL